MTIAVITPAAYPPRPAPGGAPIRPWHGPAPPARSDPAGTVRSGAVRSRRRGSVPPARFGPARFGPVRFAVSAGEHGGGSLLGLGAGRAVRSGAGAAGSVGAWGGFGTVSSVA